MSDSLKEHKIYAPKTINFAIFICSTSRYDAIQQGKMSTDISGDTIELILKNAGHKVLFRRIISDDKNMIEHAVKSVLNNPGIDAVVFSGGTGITSTDITIETVSAFFEKKLPGFGEIFRHLSYDKLGSATIMSRAEAGVVQGKAVFCIPGSPDAVRVSVELLISPEAAHIVKHARE